MRSPPAGGEFAPEALYDRLHPVIDHALRRVLQANLTDHDDLVQIVFERVVRSVTERKFAGACSLAAWATAIAIHVGIDALRARSRERAVFDDARAGGSVRRVSSWDLERQLEARADIARLQAILSSMNAARAETVLLHDVCGHELSEIAVIMGVSMAAAQSRLVRGRKELLRRLRPSLVYAR